MLPQRVRTPLLARPAGAGVPFRVRGALAILASAGLVCLCAGSDRQLIHADGAKPEESRPEGTVGHALDLGARWLLARQLPDGSFTAGIAPSGAGETTQGWSAGSILCGYALKRSRAPGTTEALKRFRGYLEELVKRAKVGDLTPRRGTYAAALAALYLFDHAGAKSPGSSETVKPAPPPPAWVKSMARELSGHLAASQSGDGLWDYSVSTPGAAVHGDVSNTHFAALGLLALDRLGVSTSSVDHERCIASLLELQETLPEASARGLRGDPVTTAEGPRTVPRAFLYSRAVPRLRGGRGFGLVADGGSTTASGMVGMLAASQLLEDETVWTSQCKAAVRDATEWLRLAGEVEGNPMMGWRGDEPSPAIRDRGPLWHHIYLWGLQVASELDKDVAASLAPLLQRSRAFLLGAQSEDGSWLSSESAAGFGEMCSTEWRRTVDTCFAMLALAGAGF